MDARLIPEGDIWCRSIKEIQSRELKKFHAVHAFNGLSGWAYALRKAGWPDDRPCFTGSAPCTPFSVAGKQEGFEDPRHLWPDFARLIRECKPATCFGEQVSSASSWLNLVRSDLEKMGYAVGAIPVQAASAGADHFRDRYWFVANRDSVRSQESLCQPGDAGPERAPSPGDPVRGVEYDKSVGWGEGWSESEFRSRGFTASVASIEGSQYIECPDGKWRRLPPPSVRWLAHGLRARISCLRAIGNSIDVRPATALIKAFLESENA